MTLQTVQLIGIDMERFQSLIGKAVAKVLQEHKELLNDSRNESGDKYLSRKEAAEFLRISETTLWNLDKTQVLPAKRLNGKVLYLKSDLLNFSKTNA
ncbi:helix-turn-helix domain-containing protein [Flagellimonas olearia]|uniref:Helix-turn-helix domain-containing protein n=1 Tax=Flagellimonas olearia TaxID=552546 RepID=A0A6I1DU47_9FLAO|nr:helix-turn-helix domain-containing protein [Allomuricauda olearia]KAB7528225.1 helix-turn-helix domain-containing protein [Allomuricauda olearia]